MSFYLALYRTGKAHEYHFALILSARNILDQPVEIYQIVQNGGPWVNGYHASVSLLSSSNFLCCIPLPPVQPSMVQTAREVLMAQQVGQGDTPLTPPHMRWSCDQWSLRALEQLVRVGCMQDQFYIAHKMWKQLLKADIVKAAGMAVASPRYGTLNGHVRVVPLN